ncbi:YjzD family protein [Bacillus xiapuensis]|uniref:YjzD family protein n=1 Tax=Bacillus xiapuensis TaxID=2014075 RepID=UPI000C235EAD|nr:YjzD family protein [Bacillus xiapuensis]
MRIIMTFFWTFLLTEMLAYVVGSMNGAEFDWFAGLIISVITTILLLAVAALTPNDAVEQH